VSGDTQGATLSTSGYLYEAYTSGKNCSGGCKDGTINAVSEHEVEECFESM